MNLADHVRAHFLPFGVGIAHVPLASVPLRAASDTLTYVAYLEHNDNVFLLPGMYAYTFDAAHIERTYPSAFFATNSRTRYTFDIAPTTALYRHVKDRGLFRIDDAHALLLTVHVFRIRSHVLESVF